MNFEINHLTTNFYGLTALQKLNGLRDFSETLLTITPTAYQELNERNFRHELNNIRYEGQQFWMGSGGWVILGSKGELNAISHACVDGLTRPAYGLKSLLVATLKAVATQTGRENGFAELHSNGRKFLKQHGFDYHIGSAVTVNTDETVGVSGALISINVFKLLYGENHPYASTDTAHLRHDQGLTDWWYAHALAMLQSEEDPTGYLIKELDEIECEQ